ncbi:MAG: hypothetical protein WA890_23385, partial [Micromonospora sp.]
MTPGEFSTVDHDLLADYVGGALDGTPEHATVARLVEEDAAWRRAYAALAPALDLVRADLAEWGSVAAPEMPAAVADRIAAALSGAGPAPTLADAESRLTDAPVTTRRLDGGDERGGRGAVAGGGQRRTGGASRPTEGPG